MHLEKATLQHALQLVEGADDQTEPQLIGQRPDIGAAVSADRANEALFQIGQPHVIGP
jgi:hypothetical protein